MQEIFKSISSAPVLPGSDIPELDLYIDQILTLFADRLGEGLGESEKPLTKTMINNYSKAGLLGQISGKKYSKENILQMLMIHVLKQSLSMQDIARILPAESAKQTREVYDRSLQTIAVTDAALADAVEAAMQAAGVEDAAQQPLLSALILCRMSNTLRRCAEELIRQSTPQKTEKETKKNAAKKSDH